MSSLPCASKAVSSAPKSPQKLRAEGCFAVFTPCLLARQAKHRREYLLFCQGVLCRIGRRQGAKTCRGSVPRSLLAGAIILDIVFLSRVRHKIQYMEFPPPKVPQPSSLTLLPLQKRKFPKSVPFPEDSRKTKPGFSGNPGEGSLHNSDRFLPKNRR